MTDEATKERKKEKGDLMIGLILYLWLYYRRYVYHVSIITVTSS